MAIKARQTYEEFVRELEQEKARERKAMASWRVQMREQRKPRVFRSWKMAVLAGLLLAGACIWVIKQIIDAVIP